MSIRGHFSQGFTLSLIQFSNLVLPFISLPYIARVLSTSDYGLINFSQAYAVYFMLLINYAFDLSAVRHVAVNSENPKKLSSIVSTIFTTKSLLFILSTALFLGITFSVPILRADYPYHVMAYAVNLGYIIYPNWLFQGLSRVTVMSITVLSIRIISLALIFIFINSPDDTLLLLSIYSFTNIAIAILLTIYAFVKFKITYLFPTFNDIQESLKDGFALFLSTITINLYTTSNTFLLGVLASTYYVGLFTSALKIIQAVQMLIMTPINQVLFPLMSKAFHESQEGGMLLLNKAMVVIVPILLTAAVGMLLFGDLAISIVFGPQFLPALPALQIMAFAPLIIGISNLLGIHGMLNLKMDKVFFYITLVGAVFCVSFNILFIPYLNEVGTALAWFLTEVVITVSMILIYYKKKIPIFNLGQMKNFAIELLRKVHIYV